MGLLLEIRLLRNSIMIRAILFDFNGVIVDDEPLHFELFQRVLKEAGYSLTKEGYYSKYLGMDDKDCLSTATKDLGEELSAPKIQELIERKNTYYQKEITKKPPFVPGIIPFIKSLSDTHYLGIVSGALRSEIELLIKLGEISNEINVIVAAGEVQKGKPSPEGFQKCLELLNRDFVAASERLLPEECLVIEDSTWGIESATQAGMPCVAVTTSYSQDQMKGALLYIKDFQGRNAQDFLNNVDEIIHNGK